MEKVLFSGVGGQGVLLMGTLLARAAIEDGYFASWVPYYGLEMRGGRAKCWVAVSDVEIPSPVFSRLTTALFLSERFLEEDIHKVERGGLLILNVEDGGAEDLARVGGDTARGSTAEFRIWATGIASKLGSAASANMVMLGAYVAMKRIVKMDTIQRLVLTERGEGSMRDLNLSCLVKGFEIATHLHRLHR